MATITIRVTSSEKSELEGAAQRAGQTLSDYVRETLDLRPDIDGLNVRVETLWDKVARLEQLAGL